MFATRRSISHVSVSHGRLSHVSGLFRTTLNVRRRSFGVSRGGIPGRLLHPRKHQDASTHSHPRLLFSTISFNDPIEYEFIDGVEPLALYEPGGYHPVMVDDLLHRRYRIVDKLGHGGYSTIWLAHDEQTTRYVALKVAISGQMLPRREPSILRALSESVPSTQETTLGVFDASTTIPQVLEVFNVRGPNGIHVCYTKTLAQGNLKEASFNRLFPIEVARLLAARLALAVSLIHSQGFVHGGSHQQLTSCPSQTSEKHLASLKRCPSIGPMGSHFRPMLRLRRSCPLYLGRMAEEFTLDDANGLILGDFGEAFAPATEERLGGDCNTPVAMRAPEALFEPDTPVSFSADIWSLGTAIWEILGMNFIFSETETMDEIVAQQIDVLGYQGLPLAWREHWERPNTEELVTETEVEVPRHPTGDRHSWPSLEQAFEEFVQKHRREQAVMGVFGDEETEAILDLMRGMLKFKPEERITIQEVLQSEWMTKWALPRLER
ncbi:kinase domain protein [Apiospora rasikravindrae]|uniref:non-specific serine/threonine protein kinase n=1 Tax=Apiospora rasikravindrae TaxID=990691 RepID=A0ABR1RPR7_9PEZI